MLSSLARKRSSDVEHSAVVNDWPGHSSSAVLVRSPRADVVEYMSHRNSTLNTATMPAMPWPEL
jgi:hypothetical protein